MGGEGRGGGQREEMTQTMYAHVNKWIKKKEKKTQLKTNFRIPVSISHRKKMKCLNGCKEVGKMSL
jgi:hypothetical protein